MSERRPDYEARFEALAAVAYKVGYRLLGDREEARDVAQEAMARAFVRWRRIATYAEPWVVRVATNLAIDRCRRRRPTVPVEDRHPAPGADPVGTALERRELVESLRRLSKRQRDVVVLRYLADLSERDVAAALGTTAGAVKQHAHRAIARLRADLALSVVEVSDVRASR